MRVAVEGELIQHDVARVPARRVGVGRQPDNPRAIVREVDFHGFLFRLRHLGEFRQDLQLLEDQAEILDLLHKQARLPLALGKNDVLRPPLQALDRGA